MPMVTRLKKQKKISAHLQNIDMPILDLTDTEIKIIEQAINHLCGLYSTGVTRSRSFGKKHINFKERKKQEERIEQIRQGYREKYSEARDLQIKIHMQITYKS